MSDRETLDEILADIHNNRFPASDDDEMRERFLAVIEKLRQQREELFTRLAKLSYEHKFVIHQIRTHSDRQLVDILKGN